MLLNKLGIIENWGIWSEAVAVKLPDVMSGSIAFQNMLSIRVLEWLIIQFGCKIKGINKFEARESKRSFA